MDSKQASRGVHQTLQDEIGDELLAVGWYDGDREERSGTHYLSDEFKRAVENDEAPKKVLENALLDRLGPGTHEMKHETLKATTKFYESFIDVHIHIDDYTGIVIAIKRDGGTPLRAIVSRMNEIIFSGIRPETD